MPHDYTCHKVAGFRFQDSSRVAALQRCSYKNNYCIYQNLTLYLYINIEVFFEYIHSLSRTATLQQCSAFVLP